MRAKRAKFLRRIARQHHEVWLKYKPYRPPVFQNVGKVVPRFFKVAIGIPLEMGDCGRKSYQKIKRV